MASPKIKPKLCPVCHPAKCYMIITIDEEDKITYECQQCGHKEFPDS